MVNKNTVRKNYDKESAFKDLQRWREKVLVIQDMAKGTRGFIDMGRKYNVKRSTLYDLWQERTGKAWGEGLEIDVSVRDADTDRFKKKP